MRTFASVGYKARVRRTLRDQSLLWEPSQSGDFPVALHPQKNTFLLSSDVNFWGAKPVPLWDPSQNGCLLDSPQVQKK
jgi:hypothetical protein